jgi:hypothetical protein
MTRATLAAAAISLLCPFARGGDTVVRFSVQPMAAPRPALKYQLLPDVEEMQSGNS